MATSLSKNFPAEPFLKGSFIARGTGLSFLNLKYKQRVGQRDYVVCKFEFLVAGCPEMIPIERVFVQKEVAVQVRCKLLKKIAHPARTIIYDHE